jgi:hypothetical protein
MLAPVFDVEVGGTALLTSDQDIFADALPFGVSQPDCHSNGKRQGSVSDHDVPTLVRQHASIRDHAVVSFVAAGLAQDVDIPP